MKLSPCLGLAALLLCGCDWTPKPAEERSSQVVGKENPAPAAEAPEAAPSQTPLSAVEAVAIIEAVLMERLDQVEKQAGKELASQEEVMMAMGRLTPEDPSIQADIFERMSKRGATKESFTALLASPEGTRALEGLFADQSTLTKRFSALRLTELPKIAALPDGCERLERIVDETVESCLNPGILGLLLAGELPPKCEPKPPDVREMQQRCAARGAAWALRAPPRGTPSAAPAAAPAPPSPAPAP